MEFLKRAQIQVFLKIKFLRAFRKYYFLKLYNLKRKYENSMPQ